MTERPRRSFLYAPADDPELMRKAAASDADAVIFDLEDAIADDALAAGRSNVADAASGAGAVEVCTRINGRGTDHWREDVAAVADAVDTFVVPKVDAACDLEDVVEAIEREATDPPEVVATIESPTGLFAAPEIATRASALAPVTALSFGLGDYATAVGSSNPNRLAPYVEPRIVSAAAVGGLEPLYAAYLDYEDLEGLERTARRARELGYLGLKAIHPAQLEVINEVFTPSRSAVDRAKRFVEAYETSSRNSLTVDGVFLDEATVGRYRRVLERHRALEG